MNKTLFLASGSASRKKLLTDAKIPFQIVSHDADESQCPMEGSLEDVVTKLAVLKMDHIVMPDNLDTDQEIFILTSDTLTVTAEGEFLCKPTSREDAVRMLKSCRQGHAKVGSGFCLEKRIFVEGVWKTEQRILGFNEASCLFDVPERDVDFYLDNAPFLSVSGGVTIESFGNQFVKDVQGSYSSIIGLPMFDIRNALFEIGFL
jgi:septum formation protein